MGDSCDLLLLSPYWRAVYCSQPALADSLADDLRRRLLDGEPLSGAGEEFSYPVVQDEATGLYVILRQPQVFDRGTMNILYTISLSSALVCLALAVVLSLAPEPPAVSAHPAPPQGHPRSGPQQSGRVRPPTSTTTSWVSWPTASTTCWWP